MLSSKEMNILHLKLLTTCETLGCPRLRPKMECQCVGQPKLEQKNCETRLGVGLYLLFKTPLEGCLADFDVYEICHGQL